AVADECYGEMDGRRWRGVACCRGMEMPGAHTTRRAFLHAACAAPFVAAASTRANAARAVRLGGPIFLKSDDPAELAREHRRLGYSAAYCPAANVDDGGRIRAIREAFAAEGVVIAEVGAWRNMLDPDSQ